MHDNLVDTTALKRQLVLQQNTAWRKQRDPTWSSKPRLQARKQRGSAHLLPLAVQLGLDEEAELAARLLPLWFEKWLVGGR